MLPNVFSHGEIGVRIWGKASYPAVGSTHHVQSCPNNQIINRLRLLILMDTSVML